MRSRREEFTKKFEELTKQEIKNYNDSLLQTHKSLEEFRRNLKDCVDMYAMHIAQLSSKIKYVESENVDLKDQIHNLYRKFESQCHDFNKLEKETIVNSREYVGFQKFTNDKLADQSNSIDNLNKVVRDESVMIRKRVDDSFQEIATFYRKSQADNQKVKEEILSLPSEAAKVKKELLKKASESAIDNAGIIKELMTIKKKSYIQEKMNEYFHIQIDRIKSSGAK